MSTPAQRMCDEGAARRFEQKSWSCFHFYSVLVPFHFILSYSILILILFDLSSTSSNKYRQHLEKYRACHIKYRRENHFWKMPSNGRTIEENKMPSLDQQKCRHSKKKYRQQKCRHSKNKMPSRPVIPEEKNTVNEVKYRHAVPSMKNVRNYAVNWQYFFFAVKKMTAFFWGGYAESVQKIPSRTKMPSRPATLEEKEYRQWRKIPSSHTFDEKKKRHGIFLTE